MTPNVSRKYSKENIVLRYSNQPSQMIKYVSQTFRKSKIWMDKETHAVHASNSEEIKNRICRIVFVLRNY